MAIVLNLDVMLAKRKRTLTQLSEATGISMPNLSLIKQGRARAIRLKTLNAFCEYFNCTPNDILEYVDDETYKEMFNRDFSTLDDE